MDYFAKKGDFRRKQHVQIIGKYVTKIVYIYDQAFKVGVVGNVVSVLNKYGTAHAKKIFGVQRGIFS